MTNTYIQQNKLRKTANKCFNLLSQVSILKNKQIQIDPT